jgi:hypothetical protein
MGMKFLLLLAAMCVALPSWAFGVSPCLRKLSFDKQRFFAAPILWTNHCDKLPETLRSGVHEHMTLITIAEYRGGEHLMAARGTGYQSNYMTERPWPDPKSRLRYTRAIIHGTWWNDDPLRYLWAQGGDFRDGARSAFDATYRNLPTYQGGGSCQVSPDKHLFRRSHFGDLQHLHFMTGTEGRTANQRVQETTDLALGWMQFAYEVATGRLKPEEPLVGVLGKFEGVPSAEDVAQNNCVTTVANAQVRTLFTPRDKTWEKYRQAFTPDIALGSMLHVMQDSFSPAHTCRIVVSESDRTYSVIADVYNYSTQRSSSHAQLDLYPDWLTAVATGAGRKFENDPVAVGKWLMDAIDARLDWTIVDKHLRETIFRSQPRSDTMSATQPSCYGGVSALK